MVNRIDRDTEAAVFNAEKAKEVLRDTYEDVSSTRKLMLKIFFILMVFTTFYIIFVL